MIAFSYEKFQLKGFEWENFGVLDNWSFMGADRLRNGGRTYRLDCTNSFRWSVQMKLGGFKLSEMSVDT